MPRRALSSPLTGFLAQPLRAVRACRVGVMPRRGAVLLHPLRMASVGQARRSARSFRMGPQPMTPAHRRFVPEPT